MNGYTSHKDKQDSQHRVNPKGGDHALVLATFRCLVADLVQQFNGGHPGGAMGMAAIGLALWKYTMRYSPSNPRWFNRDRFVLSNGHCCVFQYAFLHLTGYQSMTFPQLKSYHSSRPDSLCPGHPEIEIDGIEVTTGPLGQGIANAVGLAMASEHLGATYNREGFEVVNNMTYCTIGDACLQEGVGMEAIQLAGHFRLRNLVVLYDNNQITCDGSVDLCNTEDVDAKMRACGWNVLDVLDGNYDVEGIVAALELARRSDRPTFVNVRTVIGVGSKVQGDAQAHGAAFGVEDVKGIKKFFGMDPSQHYVVPEEVRRFFEPLSERGKQWEREYEELLEGYQNEYPDLAEEFRMRREGQMIKDWRKFIPSLDALGKDPLPSRKSGGVICNPLAQNINTFMVGTADLSPSVNMIWKDKKDFQHPDLRTACGINGDYTGRYIHWGVREHAMCAVSNGIAAFNFGTIIPITSSFFMFYIYAAPAVRMSALQRLPTIHIATHDSIGTGEDGPTHQPIALATFYRSMPNVLYIRPCDTEEVAGAFELALENMVVDPHLPHPNASTSIISLSRQPIPQWHHLGWSKSESVRRGAYVFEEREGAKVTIIGVGAEMTFAVAAAKVLAEELGVPARVVSFPCWRAFEGQSAEYKRSLLRRKEMPAVVVEAYALNGWERYADAGYGLNGFGKSGPGKEVYKWYGFDGGKIAGSIKAWLENGEMEAGGERGWWRGEWAELNEFAEGQ